MQSIHDSEKTEIIGLIPAGGMASRLGTIPCSKELLPVGFQPDNSGVIRPKPISKYLLEKYRKGGADKVYIILRPGKWDIPAYYGDGREVGLDIGYLIMDLPYGVPYTLDQAFPFTKDAKVFLGFPDILFGPEDAFAQLNAELEASDSDLVLGLYEGRDEEQIRKSDMVERNEDGSIARIIIKPREACDLSYSWIIVAWRPSFSGFMHQFLIEDQKMRSQNPDAPEIYLGHAVQAAMNHGMKVSSVIFHGQSFLDVGTPENLQEAVIHPPENAGKS